MGLFSFLETPDKREGYHYENTIDLSFLTLCSCTLLLLISGCGGDSGTDPTQPGVSGSKIAFVSSRDGNLEIYVMNADGSN